MVESCWTSRVFNINSCAYILSLLGVVSWRSITAVAIGLLERRYSVYNSRGGALSRGSSAYQRIAGVVNLELNSEDLKIVLLHNTTGRSSNINSNHIFGSPSTILDKFNLAIVIHLKKWCWSLFQILLICNSITDCSTKPNYALLA